MIRGLVQTMQATLARADVGRTSSGVADVVSLEASAMIAIVAILFDGCSPLVVIQAEHLRDRCSARNLQGMNELLAAGHGANVPTRGTHPVACSVAVARIAALLHRRPEATSE